jgi:glutamine amidotransferase-like uncharacterized protein
MEKRIVLLCAFAVVACLRVGEVCASQRRDGRPLRVAVYVGDGARNVGAFRWLEIAARAKNCALVPVDGEAVRDGALDGADVLVMPGGCSVAEALGLEEEGRRRIKEFIGRGGGYIGMGAGCGLLMQDGSGKCGTKRLGLIPFAFGASGGTATLPVRFNDKAKEMCAIRRGVWKVRYHDGPVLVPGGSAANARIEVLATYAGDVNSLSPKPRPSMAGRAAVVAGTYGKGRIFACAVQPEYDVNDHGILRGAFRYVAGRDLEWDYPQRRRGQLAVGMVVEHSLGVETARLVQRLVTEEEFDVIPVDAERIADEGALNRVDAVLAPDGPGASGGKGLYSGNLALTEAFLKRGGRVFAWGGAARAARRHCPAVTCVAHGDAALAALRDFAAQPVPAPASFPAKAANPLKAAVYCDKDGGSVAIARMLSLSPEYDVRFLRAADYAKGGLDGIDLLVQPGGSCKGQYDAMGTSGAEALRRYVLEGGRYYGVCAGAFMALQQSRPGLPRIGIVSFRGDDPSHYRGNAPIKVEITKEGEEVFKGSAPTRVVEYYGGPVPIPGKPLEDTDVKVLARYAGRTINTARTAPVEPMNGMGAFLGGRVGKGRVFLSCPHPEFTECTHDIVRAGIGYLTGVVPSPVCYYRARGAMAVLYNTSKDDESLKFYFEEFLRDRRFYVRTGFNANDCAHADAVVTAMSDAAWLDVPSWRRFAGRGGRIVVVARSADERKAAATMAEIADVVIVGSCSEIPAALLK